MDNFSTSLAEALPPVDAPRAAPEPSSAAVTSAAPTPVAPAHVANLSLSTPVPDASTSAPASAARTPTKDDEQPLVWNLKEIEFAGVRRKIVMQDTGGYVVFVSLTCMDTNIGSAVDRARSSPSVCPSVLCPKQVIG